MLTYQEKSEFGGMVRRRRKLVEAAAEPRIQWHYMEHHTEPNRPR